jgi:hypothetical protein
MISGVIYLKDNYNNKNKENNSLGWKIIEKNVCGQGSNFSRIKTFDSRKIILIIDLFDRD